MQLKDYFREQKNSTLDQNEKFFLYEKIISQKDKKSFERTKHFINIKSFAYWFTIILLFVSIYGVYFFNWDFSYEGFMVKNSINQVNADYIAKIVDFNGNFYIKHNGDYYKTSTISNWDNVILKKWSEIVFDINSGTKAKIVWPAKFSLNLEKNKYKLFISQGDFIQIESSDNKQNSMDIILNDIKISSDKNINLQITKENDQYKINNQWNKLIITQSNTTKELETKQLLTINWEEIISIENMEDFWKAIKQNNVSQIFTITNDEQNTQQEKITQTLLNDTENNDNKIINPKLTEDLWIVDNKKIPDTEQTKTLHSLLNNTFVLWNIQWMFNSYIAWDEKKYNYNKWLLISRIQKIYKLFDIKYQKTNLTNDITTLKQNLLNNYHIPSLYTDNLTTIINRVNYIEKQAYWSNKNITEIEQLWNELETNTPNYLILK